MGNLEVSGIRSEYTNNWQANKPLDEKERARRIANGIHVERKIADCLSSRYFCSGSSR